MRVRVLLFGVLREIFGAGSESRDLPEGSTLGDLLEHYRNHAPAGRRGLMDAIAAAVNQEYAQAGHALQDGDEVALLPPVSGGSGQGSGEVSSPVECQITRERISTEAVLARIKRGEDGAVATFEGIVRNHSRGRRTLYLDYEAYEPMALQQMYAIGEKALANYPVRAITMLHRLGRIEIGETSVLIVVASAHRAAAFDACRYAIDTLKKTVPIWKKEYFHDGAVWADGEAFPEEVKPAQPESQAR